MVPVSGTARQRSGTGTSCCPRRPALDERRGYAPGLSADAVPRAHTDLVTSELATPQWRRCPRCGHPARADRMIKGYGRDCATALGLTGRTATVDQDGPDLLDLLGAEPEDHCDGADRPADRA